ncbi:MAG: 50S ribosomal protein L2 [Planctomycetota bacterium]|nr:50S ribosomal protein L2 [Planctomycetota bacterium]RLT10430.1 MAG: 50S ribosomal protein L2 [Planctomycetota bacterium]
MGIKYYKPTTAGRRNASVSDFAELTDKNKKPEKSLVRTMQKRSGRNNQGFITVRSRGGGSRRMYRLVDFKRVDFDGITGTVTHIEYDPNRSARIALVQFENGKKSYILAPEGLAAGAVVNSGPSAEPKLANCLPLSKIPTGMQIHNIEIVPGSGGKMCRSAGCAATLTAREGAWAQITLPSGEVRRVSAACRATIGILGNSDHMNIRIGKAGRARKMGLRPHVRGVAMNPHDHPMGGGEGRTSGGRHPCSRTGVLAKGGKTRKPRKPSNGMIVKRRRSVRYGQLKV